MSHSYDQGTPNGVAQLRRKRRAVVALGQPGHVKFTLPCVGCKLPLLPGEKVCPRPGCGRTVAA